MPPHQVVKIEVGLVGRTVRTETVEVAVGESAQHVDDAVVKGGRDDEEAVLLETLPLLDREAVRLDVARLECRQRRLPCPQHVRTITHLLPGAGPAQIGRTHSSAVLWRWRQRISWSPSGNSVSPPEPSVSCTDAMRLSSWSANSFSDTAVISCATTSRCSRRCEVEIPLEDVRGVRRRPVVVGVVPAALPELDAEVRPDLEQRDTGTLVAAVHSVDVCGRVELGLVPRTEQPAAEKPLRRLDLVVGELPGPNAGRVEHAMRPVELVVERLEPGGIRVEVLGPLAPMDDRCVVLLLERVHEQLPVGRHLDAEGVALGQLVERVVLDADHRAEELAQRFRGSRPR